MRFLALLSVYAIVGCGSSPPQEPSAPASVASAAPPAAATSSAPPPASAAPAPTEKAAPEKTGPEKTGPEIEVVDAHEPPFLHHPGPECDGALKEPMPGKDREVPLRARIGTIQTNGRVDPADIARAIQTEARAGLGRCADLAKSRVDENISVKITWDANTAPTASDGSGKAGDPLAACVVQALGNVHYPKPSSGAVTSVVAMSYSKTEFVPADKAKLEAWAKRINAPCKPKK